jgi:cysteinyl-tRNA synthetase
LSLKVYNTLHRKKELFKPIESGKVRMYVCGPTVYNYISVGNSRPIIVFNMVRNYLEFSGYKVEYVQNITDIEDKIIKKANEEKVDCRVITDRYIKAFLEDLENLKIGGFTNMPLATEMIPGIINIIKKIMENGYGYEADGNVYFEVSKFPGYGKLSMQNITEMKDTGENDFGKRNSIDFALWKKAKEGEPSWGSPWGKGRPGWHIECSAMSTALLGRSIDIHGGGIDLIFPHHENEIAQSEAAFPEVGDFVRYWMHNGMIEVKAGKMSKSLGLKKNWVLKNLLKIFSPETIKMYILSTHYRSPLEFSMKKLNEAEKAVEKITNTMGNMKFLIEQAEKLSGSDTVRKEDSNIILKFDSFITRLEDDFKKSMDDDFNSARAIGDIFEFVKSINSIIQKPDFKIIASMKDSLSSAFDKIKKLGEILGLDFKSEISGAAKNIEGRVKIKRQEIEKLIKERETARDNKDFKKADEIRKYLQLKGVILEDRKEGTIWKLRENGGD